MRSSRQRWLYLLPLAWAGTLLLAAVPRAELAAASLLAWIVLAACLLSRNGRRRVLALLVAALVPFQAFAGMTAQARGPAHFHAEASAHSHADVRHHHHAAAAHAIAVDAHEAQEPMSAPGEGRFGALDAAVASPARTPECRGGEVQQHAFITGKQAVLPRHKRPPRS